MTDDFLWGVATSAYQIEGAAENDWTEWERGGVLRQRGIRCGAGAGHADRWRSDLALLPTIGANAYRCSVEWSRASRPRRRRWSTCCARTRRPRGRSPRARAGGRAGIAHNMLDFAPDRPGSVLDRRLAAARRRPLPPRSRRT